jgi:hypothetical protein
MVSDFKKVIANLDNSLRDERPVMANLRSDLDLQTKTRSKAGALGQDHVTSEVEVTGISLPRLEGRVSKVASTLAVVTAINVTTFAVLWLSGKFRLRAANKRGLKRCRAAIHEPDKGQLVVYEKGQKEKGTERALQATWMQSISLI